MFHLPDRSKTLDTVVNGLVFDLDNTLLDRQATFIRVAGSFYEEHLCATASSLGTML